MSLRRYARFLLFALATCVTVADAPGLIVFDSATSVDNTFNVIDPANSATFPTGAASGAPWQHVIRYGVNNASAVYLGNGFLLTPRHVSLSNSGLLIQGTSYNRDTSFTPVPIIIPASPSNVAVDLTVQKIIGDPGLPVLTIAASTANDLNTASVLVGWGKGKGSVVSGQGWTWGDDSTHALRWGTNTTGTSTEMISYGVPGGPVDYVALTVDFNSTQGASEAAATLGDSGSALFLDLSGTWTLCGLAVTVTRDGASYYDTDTIIDGDQSPDQSYFIRLREYSWVLRYDLWKAHYGIATATADTDDADGDGVPLLAEYALGLDPTKLSVVGLPKGSADGANVALTFTRLGSATDIKIEVETSPTLAPGSWTIEPATVTVLDGTTVIQRVKATVAMGSGDRKFARLKITRL